MSVDAANITDQGWHSFSPCAVAWFLHMDLLDTQCGCIREGTNIIRVSAKRYSQPYDQLHGRPDQRAERRGHTDN
jgi:hypothetical protein